MGLNYSAEVVLYNRAGGEIGVPTEWFPTLLKKVRVDLKKSVNVGESGAEAANTCSFSIYDADLPKSYLEPEEWAAKPDRGFYFTFDSDSFIVISHAPELGITSRNLPVTGTMDPNLMEKLKKQGHVYHVTGSAHYSLIPHWEIDAA